MELVNKYTTQRSICVHNSVGTDGPMKGLKLVRRNIEV
jgi:hypothetical protein